MEKGNHNCIKNADIQCGRITNPTEQGGSLEECARSLFPQEGETTPRLRFQGLEGEWVRAKLGDLGKAISGYTFPESEQGGTEGIPFYKVSDMNLEGNEFVMQHSKNYVTSSQTKKYSWKICPVPCIFFAKVGAAVLLDRKRLILTPSLFDNNTMAFSFSTEKIDPYFCLALFQHIKLSTLVQVGTLPSYNGTIVENVGVLVPSSIEEQQLIGSFFRRLDAQIAIQQQRLEQLKQMKSACLRSMFPQNGGCNLPLIRFKEYDEAWVLYTFTDIAERVSASGKSGLLPGVEFEDIISGQGELNKNVYEKKCNKSGNMFKKDDVLFGKLRPYLKNILLANFEGVAIGDFWVLRPKDVEPYLLYLLVSSEQFMEVANISSGSKMPRADWNLVSKSQYLLPASHEEQHRIASFFRSLDTKISLQTQRIEKLKQMKTACLSRMIA